jgi:hypothetical protein
VCFSRTSDTNQIVSDQRKIYIAYRNATTSPLLRLPAEIRNMIYTFALGIGTIRMLHFRHGLNLRYGLELSINLLRVCHQVYTETCLLPYKLNTFDFIGASACVIKKFLAMRNEAQIAVLSKVKNGNSQVHTAVIWEERLRDDQCTFPGCS